MRYVYLALLLAMAAVVFLFRFQNPDAVTFQFLPAGLTLLLLSLYGHGMRTDGVVLSLIRSRVHGAITKPPMRG